MTAVCASAPQQEVQPADRLRLIRRCLPTLAIGAMGAALSVAAWFVVANWENRTAKIEFQARASNSALTLQGGVNEYINNVAALRALFGSSPREVSRTEFEKFARELLKGQNAIRAVSWIPRVTREERVAHEKAAAADGLPGYSIKALNPDNSLVISPQKAEYFPIYFRSGSEVSRSVYGLDIGDRGSRQKALERARDTDGLAVSQTIMLQSATGDRRGFFVLLPVYRQGVPHGTIEERRRNLQGFVEGAFQTSVMVEQILGQITTPVDLYMTRPDGGLLPIHIHPSRRHSTDLEFSEASSAGFTWSGLLKIADTQWKLIAWPSSDEAVISHMTAWIVLVAGLLLTCATTVYLWSSARQALGLIQMNERISELARRDPLTNLANRGEFSDRLSRSFLAAARSGTSFAVLYFDLDHFKDVNDTLGHAVGDALLRLVAERLNVLVRQTDLVARFGGDEFAVLIPDASDASIPKNLADRIIEALGSPYMIDGNHVRITASIGISHYSPDVSGPESMMMQADLALYRAKEDGRNCVRFHTADLDDAVKERVTIAEDLHSALERGEFELYYQPQVELSSGRIIGVEALVRWNHPKRGFVLPSAFIPIAERTGIILPLGKWVFEEACRQTKLWNEEGIAPQVVGVNISAVQCMRSHIVKDIGDCLAKWDIRPDQMEVELTESVLMEATRNNCDIVDRLRKLGLRIAIDDFGTGYSSLDYLTNYPVDRLKIAQELVFGVTTDVRNASVVKIALRLGKELGIEVIAEGVQTDAQVRFLASAGCNWAQGYFFSKPVNAQRATELLRQRLMELSINRRQPESLLRYQNS